MNSVELRTHVVRLIVDSGARMSNREAWRQGNAMALVQSTSYSYSDAGAKESDPLPRRSIILVHKVAGCIGF